MSKKEITPEAEPLTVRFRSESLSEKDKDGFVQIKTDIGTMCDILQDDNMNQFFQSDHGRKFLAIKIGVKALSVAFSKEDICKELSWNFIKEYYLDHMDKEEILNYIGFETAMDHFKEKLQQSGTTQKDINTGKKAGKKKSLLEVEDAGESK